LPRRGRRASFGREMGLDCLSAPAAQTFLNVERAESGACSN
jgi:hypothetical protein